MISGDDVKKLASLARIKLTKEEEDKLAKDMENILGFVEQIKKVSASVEKNKEANRNAFRDDENPHESGAYNKELLRESPKREGDYVKVKKIL